MKQKCKNRIVAMFLLMALTVGLFEPRVGNSITEAKDKAKKETKQEQKLIEEFEQEQEKKLVECKNKRTEDSTTYERGDGRKTIEFHGKAVRFRDKKTKELLDYDDTLQKTSKANYGYENKVGDKKHYLPKNLNKESPILTEYKNVQMSLLPTEPKLGGNALKTAKKDTKEIKETPENLYLNTDIKSNKKAITGISYPSGEGTRYQYTSQNDGIKETIVLDKKPKTNQLSFQFKLKNAYAKAVGGQESEEAPKEYDDKKETTTTQGKEIQIFNNKNQNIANIPFASFHDAGEKNNQPTEEAYGEDTYYLLDEIGEKTKGNNTYRIYQLTMVVSQEYFQSQETQYPVTIKSSMTWTETDEYTIGDTYVRSGSNNNYRNDETMKIGSYESDRVRSYLTFANLEQSLKGKYIDHAELYLKESDESEKGVTVNFKRVLNDWDLDKITDANQPAWEETVQASLTTSGTEGTEQSADLTTYITELVQKKYPNTGLAVLPSAKDSDDTKAASFYTTESETANHRPYLKITYYEPPSAPAVSLSDTYIKKGKDITLTWNRVSSPSLSTIQYRIAKADVKNQVELESVVDYSKDTKLGTTAEGSETIDTSSLAEGSYYIVGRGVDTQGNVGIEQTSLLMIDSTAATLSSASLSPATISTKPSNKAPTLTWSGAGDANFDRIEYQINGSSYVSAGKTTSGEIILSTASLSSEKVNTIKVRAVDQSGNVSTEKTLSYYYDDVKPVIKKVTFNYNTDYYYANVPPTASWEIEDTYFYDIEFTANGSYLGGSPGANGTMNLNGTPFTKPGLYIIQVVASDRSGNVSTASYPYYFTPPEYTRPGIPLSEYQPKELLCTERWDGMSELSWVCMYNQQNKLPDDIRYEIHRSTTKDFTPSSTTKINENVKDNYYLITNNTPNQMYYYKVRAVQNSTTYGNFSETSSKTMPEGETRIRMGKKHYLPYQGFLAGNISGSIEQIGGNVFAQMSGISVPSKELSITIAPVYNSASNGNDGMGMGWMLPYSMRLKETSSNTILYQDETGAKYELTLSAGIYQTNENRDLSLVKSKQETRYQEWESTYQLKQKENITYHFDERGRLMLMEETGGDYLVFFYEANHGCLSMILTSTKKVVTFTYDEASLAKGEVTLTKVSFPDTSSLEYHRVGNQLTRVSYHGIDENNKKVINEKFCIFEYNSSGRMIKSYDGKGHAYQIGYTSEGTATGSMANQITMPNGEKTTLRYEPSVKKTTIENTRAGSLACQSREVLTYDESLRVQSKIDAMGLETKLLYGDHRTEFNTNPTSKLYYSIVQEKKQAVEQVVSFYNVVTTNIKQVTNNTSYDSKGNVLTEKDEQGNTTEYKYTNTEENTKDLPSQIVESEVTGATTSNATIGYDANGNEIKNTESISKTVTDTTYTTSNGIKTETETTKQLGLQSNTQTEEMAANGDMTKENGEAGSVVFETKYKHDAMGRVIETEEEKSITNTTYDFMGRVVKTETTWKDSGVIERETKKYDENGNVEIEESKEGVNTQTHYDSMNRILSTTIKSKDGISRTTTYAYSYESVTVYDGKTELKSGESETYEGALKTITKDNNNKITNISYTNGLGQVVRSIVNGIYTDFTYDEMGRVTVTYLMGKTPCATGGKVTVQCYDAAGNVTNTLVNPVKAESIDPIQIPSGYEEMNLSSYLGYFATTVYRPSQGATVNDGQSVFYELNQPLQQGEKLHVIVQGKQNGNPELRSFLVNEEMKGISNISHGISGGEIKSTEHGFRWEYTLKATEDDAKYLIFKGAAPGSPNTQIDFLNLYSIAVKYETRRSSNALTLDLTNSGNYNKIGYGATAGWDENEKAVKFKNDNHGEGLVFKFTLPEGDTLANYESIRYDIKFDSEFRVSYKQMRADVVTSMNPSNITSDASKATYGAGIMYNETDTEIRGWHTEQNIDPFSAPSHKDKTGTVYLAMGLHAGGSADSGGNAFFIKNVRLMRRGGVVNITPTNPSEQQASSKLPRLTLTNPANQPTVVGGGPGTLKFADCDGVPVDFHSKSYDSLKVKAILYSDEEGTKPIRDFSDINIGGTKVCLNDTTNSEGYNWGYGDGYQLHYLNNKIPSDLNTSTAEVTLSYDLTSLAMEQVADCITAQITGTQDIKAVKIVSMVFNSEVTSSFAIGTETIHTSKEYDSLGNVKSERDEIGVKTKYLYDSQKRITQVLVNDGSGELTERTYEYDIKTADGNILTRTTDAKGNKSEEKRNAAGQLLETIDYDGSKSYTTRYEYDTFGNLSVQTQPNGDYIKYEYNEKQQVKQKKCYRNENVSSMTEYEYNSTGNVTKMKDYTYVGDVRLPLRTEVTGYDELQRKTTFSAVDGTNNPSEEQLQKARVLYEYDNENRIKTMTYPKKKGLKSLSYEYNEETGQLWKVEGNVIGFEKSRTLREYKYNNLGDVETILDSLDYLSGGDRKLIKSYEYDTFQRVEKIKYADSKKVDESNQPIVRESFEYKYDKKSQIEKENHQNSWTGVEEGINKTTSYGYTRLGRLKESEEVSKKPTGEIQTKKNAYEYDRVGNLIKQNKNGEITTYTYNGLNQIKSSVYNANSWTYTYDANGNQTEVRNNVEYKSYEYDVENRLIREIKQDNRVRSVEQKNAYNGNGQRIHKILSLMNGNYQEEDKYFYEGSSVLYETSGTNTGMDGADIAYFYGGNDNVIVAEEWDDSIGEQKVYGYTKDIRGSSKDLIDSLGQMVVRYGYDDFGETSISGSGSGVAKNEIMYTGGIYDQDMRQYYLNARYYKPSDGAFLTQDSYRGEQRDSGTWNLYAYCNGNPINYIDPTGHKLVLHGNSTQKKDALSALNILTSGLVRLNKDGMTVEQLQGPPYRKYAAKAVFDVMNYKGKVVPIKPTSGNNGFDGSIYYNPKSNPKIWVKNGKTGRCTKKRRPSYIGLAHELIHAMHTMNGTIKSGSDNWTFTNANGKRETQKSIRKEELATIGLKYNSSNDNTENRIRKEFGLWERGAYYS